ncbi:MAG: methylated-DNA--[Eubacterium sp.]|nr:methylated-DNA--[protein]-cysteine S-methyltransferase [Eubacterium sp.]
MQYINHYESPIGGITLASDGQSLTGLWFEGQKYYADTLETDYYDTDNEITSVNKTSDTEGLEKALTIFKQTHRWLDLYFKGKVPDFTPPLSPAGSDFRREVWDILLSIPFGQTMTYGEIAARIAHKRGLKSMSSQAVGGAVAHNPISIIIPCHRVIGSNGSLTGYAGGIDKKIHLLTLEKE